MASCSGVRGGHFLDPSWQLVVQGRWDAAAPSSSSLCEAAPRTPVGLLHTDRPRDNVRPILPPQRVTEHEHSSAPAGFVGSGDMYCPAILALVPDRKECVMVKRMRNWLLGSVVVVGLCLTGACIDFPEQVTLLPVGSPFIVQGTAAVVDRDGPCPVWVGENGITYHLFQATTLDSETFDQLVEPGTVSRLVIVTRTDIELACEFGTIVEVRDVLEIVE